MKKLALPLLSLLLLSGCAGMSMFGEYRLSKEATQGFARQNAIANLCVIRGHLTSNDLGELLYSMSSLIKISSGFDKEYYTQEYNYTFDRMAAMNPTFVESNCTQWKSSGTLADVTQHLSKQYQDAAQFLANERQKDAMHLASFVVIMNAIANSSDPMKYNNIVIPGVSFVPQAQTPALPKNLLVNTSGGIHQCRTTTNGVVLCF